jgi:hypothetical protein
MRKKRKKQTIFEVCVHNQEDKEKYSRARIQKIKKKKKKKKKKGCQGEEEQNRKKPIKLLMQDR